MAELPQQSAERPTSESPLYCLVPPELAELREVIAGDLPEDVPVEVLVERRRRDRRSGADRRREAEHPPAGIERRLAHDLEGRRFAERRALLVPAQELPPMSPEVRRYADRIRFMRRDEGATRAREAARLRALAAGWRERCGEAGQKALANLVQGRTDGRDALAAALGARDAPTWEHSSAVVRLALECAEEIGLSDEQIIEVHDVALLHDIGKIGIPDAILRKPGPLSDAEWEIMRQHPTIGAQLIGSIESLSHLGPAVRAEHERWDGRGYPDGLAGEQIPLASRIVFACDAYHAMVSNRPYREPLSQDAARGELAENLGSQFWSEAASGLITVLERRQPQDHARAAITRLPPLDREPQHKRRREDDALGKAAPLPARDLRSRVKAQQRLYEQAGEQLEAARSAAKRLEIAWRVAAERRDALKRALERLLDATQERHGYTPSVFPARVRAEAILRGEDTPDLGGESWAGALPTGQPSLGGEPARPRGEGGLQAGEADPPHSQDLRSRVEAHRRLYEQAGEQLETARSAAKHYEAAWIAAAEWGDALNDALEHLLEATDRRHRHRPSVFLARVRAKAVLRAENPQRDRPA